MLVAMRRRFVAHAQPCAFTIRKFNGKLFVLHKEEFDMRHLVIAVVVAAGACLVGSLGASATPANGQAILMLPIMRTPSLTWLVGADAVGIATVVDTAFPDAS